MNGKFHEHNIRAKFKILKLHGGRQFPQNYTTVICNKIPESVSSYCRLEEIENEA